RSPVVARLARPPPRRWPPGETPPAARAALQPPRAPPRAGHRSRTPGGGGGRPLPRGGQPRRARPAVGRARPLLSVRAAHPGRRAGPSRRPAPAPRTGGPPPLRRRRHRARGAAGRRRLVRQRGSEAGRVGDGARPPALRGGDRAVSPPAMAPEEVLRALARQGLDGAEVFLKHGRSRRLELTVGGEAAVWSEERAWAVRAGNRRGSFFAGGTGEPPPEGPWAPALGRLLVLPEASAGAPWSEPGDFDAPLIGESEGFGLLRTIGRELAVELPGARLLHAALEDGWSEGDLASSRGVRARRRQRVASLHVEASGPARPARIGNAPAAASLYLAAREARRFQAKALARHLADRLSVNASTTFPDELADRPLEVLLAPPAGARLLAGLLPLLVGPRAASRGAALRDPRGRLASDLLTVIDDGRLAGGVFEPPLDGEGVASREVVLVEDGIFRQALLALWQADGAG